MLKKTMIIVGAIAAAAMSMPDAASAALHRSFHSHRYGYAAWMPRHAHTAFRLARPSWHHAFRYAAPSQDAAYAPRHHGWHRVAMRRRVPVAYQAFPVPFAGLGPLAGLVPGLAAPAVAAQAAPTQAVPAPAAGAPARAAGWHRVAGRRRLALAYNAVPVPASGLLPFSAPALAAASTGGRTQLGRASFYGGGGRTAAGGHVGAATCAHRWLPFGTRVLVTNLANARSKILTVNDRGPFVAGRIVDVSVGAAGALGMLHSGTAPVRVQVVGGPG